MTDTPLFEYKDVHVRYRIGSSIIHALQGINIKGYAGKTLGVVGESGCGKSTLAKALLGLVSYQEGEVLFEGKPETPSSAIQMVFQDPDASLNPRMSVFNHLKEALLAHQKLSPQEVKARIEELFHMVQIPLQFAEKYPYQLSGGQKQRISIARALSIMPKLIVCDEPLASLDVSISAQMIQLFKRLQTERNLAYLFITHDLASLSSLAHTVAVLYLGNLLELAPCDALYTKPLHPYTQGLLSSVLTPDPEKEKRRDRIVIAGELPSIVSPPSGCPFHTRCPLATDLCKKERPVMQEKAPGHFVACHFISG